MTTGPTRRSEAGTTLIELIVTVAIMGFAMLALLGGIGTSIIFSDIQRNDASIGLVLTSAAERLVGDTTTYVSCATPGAYQPSLELPGFPVPDGFDVTVTSVSFWDPQGTTMFGTTCPAPESGLQLIRLTATSTNLRRAPEVQTLEIVKRLAAT